MILSCIYKNSEWSWTAVINGQLRYKIEEGMGLWLRRDDQALVNSRNQLY